MADDEIRSMSRDEVRDLVERCEETAESMKSAVGGDKCTSDVALIGLSTATGIDLALSMLRTILARPVLEWEDIPGQQAAQAGPYFVGLGADGLWRAAWDREMVGDTYATIEAAKAACEAHARGQG